MVSRTGSATGSASKVRFISCDVFQQSTMLTEILAHESPYLNKWNTEVLLQPGMTFTNEPGIYLENRFGVRHEDIYLVTGGGEAELLSGRRARNPYDP